ncbi:sporulation protein [Streptomyces sp. NPDC018964]|uniref:sporulation protein n=1 Tax=unclassified Streptomyces TaxID=2593676 RepID=UPI003796069C
MVFTRLLGPLGMGGPTVDTMLDPGPVRPGGALTGQVRLKGGRAGSDIEAITLELVARVEAEHGEGGSEDTVAFERFTVGGGFRLAEGEERDVPFSVPLPWETPVTELHGQPLGVALGVRAELSTAGAKDKGDPDPLAVGPLPVQEAVLEAFGALGFGLRSADLEYGRIGGTGQRLPFRQEIEIAPSSRYADRVNEVEVTFLAGPGGMEVVLEADKRGGLLSGGHDAPARFTVGLRDSRDWTAEVDGWMRELVERRALHGFPVPHGSHDPHGSYDHHRPGPGMGTVVAVGAAGLAVGVLGGMVAAEAVDEIGDFFQGGEEEE